MTNKMKTNALQSILWAGNSFKYAKYSAIQKGFKYKSVLDTKAPLPPTSKVIRVPSWCVFPNQPALRQSPDLITPPYASLIIIVRPTT